MQARVHGQSLQQLETYFLCWILVGNCSLAGSCPWTCCGVIPVRLLSVRDTYMSETVVLTTVSAVIVSVTTAFTVGRTATVGASLACFAFVQIAVVSLPLPLPSRAGRSSSDSLL